MRIILVNAVAVLLLWASVAVVPAQQQAQPQPPPIIPVRDFFRNPETSAYQLSPNGQWLSWLAPVGNRQNVFVRPLADANAPAQQLTRVTEQDVDGYFWKGDYVLYLLDEGGDENYRLFAVPATGGEPKPLTPAGSVAQVVASLQSHPTEMLVSLNQRNPEYFDVYRLNVQTGALTLVLQNDSGYVDYTPDHRGQLRIAIQSDGVNSTFLHRPADDKPFRRLFSTTFREQVSPLFFDSTNTSLYALSNRGRDKLVLVRLNPATGQELEVVYQNPNFDLDGAVYSRANRQLAAIEWEGDRPDMLCLLPTWKKAYLKVNDQARAEGMDLVAVEYVNADTLERTSLWVAHSDRVAARYYLYNAQTQEVKFLAAVYQWLKPSQLAQMQPVTFPAADGLKLHAYLTLPVNVPKRNLPLVLLVHGGPWARDGWGFQPEVQFLANRGYAVLQVNFRGSTGYGRQYWEKSFGQWGLKMQDDLRDAVRWAVRTGLADSTRVAIYGGSYGGYATLAGLCFQPELYRCGIDYVGVSNLFTFLNTIPPYWKPYLEMLHEMVGHPQRDSLRLRQTSPVFHVQNIRAPLLIAQGARDPRVNQAESDQMVAALRARNIPVQYMLKENEGHGFSNEENTLEFYQAMETFLQQHLGAR